jgi:hypothetical protein
MLALAGLAQALPLMATGGPEAPVLATDEATAAAMAAEFWENRWGIRLDHGEYLITKDSLGRHLPMFNADAFLDADPATALALFNSHLEQLEGIKGSYTANANLYRWHVLETHGVDSLSYAYAQELSGTMATEIDRLTSMLHFTKLGRARMHQRMAKLIRVIPASLYPSSFRVSGTGGGPGPDGPTDMPTVLHFGVVPEPCPAGEDRRPIEGRDHPDLVRYFSNVLDTVDSYFGFRAEFETPAADGQFSEDVVLKFKQMLTDLDGWQFATSHVGDQFWRKVLESPEQDHPYNLAQVHHAKSVLVMIADCNEILESTPLAAALIQAHGEKELAVEAPIVLPKGNAEAPSGSSAEAPGETKAPAEPKRLRGGTWPARGEDDEALGYARSALQAFGRGMSVSRADFDEEGLEDWLQDIRLERLDLSMQQLESLRAIIQSVREDAQSRVSRFPPEHYFYHASQVRTADGLLKELDGYKTALASTRLGRIRLGEALGKVIHALSAAHPEFVAQSQRLIQEQAALAALEKREREAQEHARRERRHAHRERKTEARRTQSVFAASQKELEGKVREPTPEELQADRDFEALVAEDRPNLRRKGIEAKASPSSSSSSSSSSAAPSPRSDRLVLPVAWLPEAEAEDFSPSRVKDVQLRKAIHRSIDNLRLTGRLSGSKQVAPGIYELRPRGGQSTWRILYALHEGTFRLLALTREALEKPNAFHAGLAKASTRLKALGAPKAQPGAAGRTPAL